MHDDLFLIPFSATKKQQGKLKVLPEDFLVEEITEKGHALELNKFPAFDAKSEGKFLHCILQKESMDTITAVEKIARALKIKSERITFAGTKDSNAVTTQMISFFDLHREEVEKVKLEGVTLTPIRYGGKVFLGNLQGNRFTVTVRNIHASPKEIQHHIEDTLEELNGQFPNYFGEQRFGGDAPFTHIVGRCILEGKFKGAVDTYLASGTEFGIYERRLREHIDLFPKGHVEAIKLFPYSLRRMFVHAYQSYLFNKALSRLLHATPTKIPIVGYEYKSPLVTTKEIETMNNILKEERIDPKQFRIKELPELSSAGESRSAFVPFKDFVVLSLDKDEINKGRQKVVLRFSLQKGSYATVLLREFFTWRS